MAHTEIDRSRVIDHYDRDNLIAAIESALGSAGKSLATVTLADLAPVDEFHIGGRHATTELTEQLNLTDDDHVLDIGCGLGGPARFIAATYRCRVTGIDLTPTYVAAGNQLCGWVGLDRQVSLLRANAVHLPFANATFSAATMLHVGMNIGDKAALFCEIARVLQRGARIGVYDVMHIGDGALRYPVPWANDESTSALSAPEDYLAALRSAGFEIISERDRRAFAIGYFEQQRAQAAAGAQSPLGLQILMGERRREQVRNMSDNITAGVIAPVEIIARKT